MKRHYKIFYTVLVSHHLSDNFLAIWGTEVNYTGDFKNGLANGVGQAFVAAKNDGGLLVFSGAWLAGSMEGQGSVENLKTGYKYRGHWKDGLQNGNGSEDNPEASRTSEGEFLDGKLNGYGEANFSWCGK